MPPKPLKLHDKWVIYRESVYRENTPGVLELIELRNAFFAGALSYQRILCQAASDGASPKETLQALEEELRQYSEWLIRQARKPPD